MARLSFGRGGAPCAPRPGGSFPFVDPDENGLEAEVFWRPEVYRRVLHAYVRNGDGEGLGAVISLGEVRCRKTLLKIIDGEQHLLLRDRRRVAQVRCIGEDIRVEPFELELVVDRFPDVGSRQRLIRRLADLYRGRRLGGPKGQWTVEATRHRDALAAFDLRRQGLSYQEIARFIHGDTLVDEEWSNPNATMKNRTIRNYKRGVRYIAGDYRKLLE